MTTSYRLYFFAAAVFLCCKGSSAQTNYITQVAVNKTCDLLTLNNLDLLNRKKIILIGESSHRIKEFNRFKKELAICLNEKNRIQNLLIESGFAELLVFSLSNINLNSNNLKKYIYSIWNDDNYLELFQYLNVNKQNLETYGIDIQPCSFVFTYFMDSILVSNNIDSTFKEKDSIIVNYSIKRQSFNAKRRDRILFNQHYSDIKKYYGEIIKKINNNKSLLKKSFTDRQIALLIKAIKTRIDLIPQLGLKNISDVVEFRDKKMSENIIWLYESKNQTEESFLVFTHNMHLDKKSSYTKKYKMMGEHLKNYFHGKSLHIGMFYGYHKNKKNKSKSIEYQLSKQAENKYFFINLSNPEKLGVFSSRFDGVIYLKTVHESETHPWTTP